MRLLYKFRFALRLVLSLFISVYLNNNIKELHST